MRAPPADKIISSSDEEESAAAVSQPSEIILDSSLESSPVTPDLPFPAPSIQPINTCATTNKCGKCDRLFKNLAGLRSHAAHCKGVKRPSSNNNQMNVSKLRETMASLKGN